MNRRILISYVLLLALIPLKIGAQNPINTQSIAGSWFGRLNLSGVTLRIVFNLSMAGNDSLAATLDSPDQGAKGIKIGPVKIENENIKISAPTLLGEYNGTIKNDTLIDGTWKQAGNTWPLSLTKLKKEFTLNRPQEPKPPFPYISEDVKFRNEKANILLAGTLTLPNGNGPFPAAILITGSGSQNRNEELMGHKPFLVIADYLTRNGIAVLRVDDRGVGQSEAGSVSPTTLDFATDVQAAFDFLRTKGNINPKFIGLIGHSEGGLIAPIEASTNHDIAFIISLSGTGVPGEQILYRQTRDINKTSGMKEAELKSSEKMAREMYAVLKKEPNNKKATEEMSAILQRTLARQKSSPEDVKKALDQFPVSAATLTSPWFRTFLVLNPAVYWKKVTCPVLALNGEKDLQVAYDVNLPAIKKALISGGNKKVTTRSFPDLNHLYQHCKTGLISEYGEIEETFSPEVLKIMSDWIHGL
jgi:uncharacterized protein